MKKLSLLLAGFSIGLALSAPAAVFTSDTAIPAGNTNFDGDDIEVIGCTVTIDGPHTFSDVFVIANGVIAHSPATNSEDVGLDLTVSNYVVIEAGSGIIADGLGYAGGNGPGAGSSVTNTLTFGLTLASGAGGSYGGNGSASIGGAKGHAAYGSLATPTNAGSGGGAGVGLGGAGGGIVKLNIGGALILDGRISAEGGPGSTEASGGGSGGSIFITFPMISGAGTISANGGPGESSNGGGGGGGRVMVAFTNNDFNGSISARGGDGAMPGGAGTIYFPAVNSTPSLVLLDNGGLLGTNTPLNALSDVSVTVQGGAIASLMNAYAMINLVIESNSWVTGYLGHPSRIQAKNVTVDAGGGFNFNGTSQTEQPGSGSQAEAAGEFYGGGGGHGGRGGNGFAGMGGATFDSAIEPLLSGGSGASGTFDFPGGGSGGNALEIVATQTIAIDGLITANGEPGSTENSGGGAGGSVYLMATTLTGHGSITANGGDAGSADGGGGGGGIIAFTASTNNFSGTLAAHGGTGYMNGGAGTFYALARSSSSAPKLIIDNDGLDGPPTPLTVGQASVILTNAASASIAQSLQSENLYISSNCFLICSNLSAISSQNLEIETNGGIIAESAITNSNLPQSGATLPNTNGATSGGGGAGAGFGGNSALGAAGGNPTLLQEPNTFASGAGGGTGGGGGGSLRVEIEGAALVNGRISADGGSGNFVGSGGGGGGTVNLTVGSLAGAGVVSANGGAGQFPLGGGGGGGTINLTINQTNLFAGTLTAYGGDGASVGGAGVIVQRTNQGVAQLILDNNGRAGTNTFLTSPQGGLFDVTVLNGAVGQISGLLSDCRNVVVGSNSALTLMTNNATLVELRFLGNLTVQTLGLITADGKGGAPSVGRAPGGAGGSHGGLGGSGAGGPTSPANSESVIAPTQSGLGGQYVAGIPATGGRGGGPLLISCGLLTVDGQIRANGQAGISEGCGGGAGGTISIHATSFAGNGSIIANGGAGNLPEGGGGGGGRIAVQATTSLFSGTLSAAGGPGFEPGGAGTIYTQLGTAQGALVIDNGGNSNGYTAFPQIGNLNVTLQGNAIVFAPSVISPASLILESNSFLVATNNTLPTMTIEATGNVTIAAGCGISCDAVSRGQNQLGGLGASLPNGDRTGGGGANAGNGGEGEGGSAGGTAPNESVAQAGTAGGEGGGGDQDADIPALGGGGLSLSVKGILEVDGVITAKGADATSEWCGGGAGGSVNIFATRIAGTGSISADGGSGNLPNGGGGGGGRVSLSVETNSFSGLISAYGGEGFVSGGAGTVYIATLGLPPQLIIDNGGLPGAATPMYESFPPSVELTVTDGAILQPRSLLSLGELLIESNAFIRELTNNYQITVSGDAEVGATAAITADGGGWNADTGPGAGTTASNYTSSGGGYGGAGGVSQGGAAGGETNGSPQMPLAWGSGGGVLFGQVQGFSQGGGAIALNVAGTLTVSGVISANGNNAVYPGSGGGAGGSIWLTAGTLAGNGLIAAEGGAAQDALGGGGGGGRIAVYSPSDNFTGSINADGGSGFAPGGVGSIYVSTNKAAAQIGAAPVPGLEISQPTAPTLLTLSWVGSTGASYQAQSSIDLIHWQPIGSVIAGEAGSMKVTLTSDPSSQQNYFRLVIIN